MRKHFLIFIAFTILSSLGYSQLVNIEKVRREEKQGFQGYINLGFNFNQNVRQIFSLRNDISLQYTKGSNTFLILNDVNYMFISSDNKRENLINQNFQHFRYNYSFANRDYITYELLFQRQVNKIQYMDFRFISGSGLRFRLVNNDRLRLFFAPLFIYETEKEHYSADKIIETSVIKANIYINILLKLNETLSFSNVTYYQPALIDFKDNFNMIEDFRLSSESSFNIKIWEDRLFFSVVFDMTYNSRPPQRFIDEYNKDKILFYTLQNSIRFNF